MSAGGAALRVAILAFDEVEALDLAGPCEVFTTAGRLAGEALALRTARQKDLAWTRV